jgi:hypothetical protein
MLLNVSISKFRKSNVGILLDIQVFIFDDFDFQLRFNKLRLSPVRPHLPALTSSIDVQVNVIEAVS